MLSSSDFHVERHTREAAFTGRGREAWGNGCEDYLLGGAFTIPFLACCPHLQNTHTDTHMPTRLCCHPALLGPGTNILFLQVKHSACVLCVSRGTESRSKEVILLLLPARSPDVSGSKNLKK